MRLDLLFSTVEEKRSAGLHHRFISRRKQSPPHPQHEPTPPCALRRHWRPARALRRPRFSSLRCLALWSLRRGSKDRNPRASSSISSNQKSETVSARAGPVRGGTRVVESTGSAAIRPPRAEVGVMRPRARRMRYPPAASLTCTLLYLPTVTSSALGF